MSFLLDFIDAALVLVALGASLMALILFPLAGGYFGLRLLLKLMGLHSGSPEQVRNEIKFALFCFAVFLLILACGIGDDLLEGHRVTHHTNASRKGVENQEHAATVHFMHYKF